MINREKLVNVVSQGQVTGNYSFLADINSIFHNSSKMEFLSSEEREKHTVFPNDSGHNPNFIAHIMWKKL
jgi:hypothetical protein